jgi:hypothetical protein
LALVKSIGIFTLKKYGLWGNSFHLDMYNDYVYRNV